MDFENESIFFWISFLNITCKINNLNFGLILLISWKNSSSYPELEWCKVTRTILPSVVQFSPEATIYVADNASTDDSVAFVKAIFQLSK
jgi:hypothetical protein